MNEQRQLDEARFLRLLLMEWQWLDDIDMTKPDINRAIRLAADGLVTLGEQRKQWRLKEILTALGVDLGRLRQELARRGHDWENGRPL